LLAEVSDEVLDRLATASSIVTYESGESIIASADERDVFVLADGKARLVMRGVGVPDVGVLDHAAGELLGVLGAVDGSDRDVVVVANGDCRVVRIPADAAAVALASSSGLAAAFEQLGVSRRRRCDRALRRAQRLADAAMDVPVEDGASLPGPENTS
jgi:signal-transduction protein with cAMP-binding, CBS, and nucleotidyltransferase domain